MSDLAALVAAAQEMLPAGIGLGWADPRLEYSLLAGEVLARAVPRRQREFSAGRAAARMALGLTDQPLPMRPDRAPLWPAGWVGSISHSQTACLAIAAPVPQFRGLGVDLEPATPLEPDLWETILTPGERQWISALPQGDHGFTAKLIFSAKEAAYKAQYPISEHLFGFENLQIIITAQMFTAHFIAPTPGIPAGSQFKGAWRLAGDQILTLVTIPA